MKKISYLAAICAAVLLGFSACSDSLTDIPENPDTRTVILADPWIVGPSSIELDQLYFFEVKGGILPAGATFRFDIEDTYFNDPTSYAVYIAPQGNRIGVIFNKYGHFKITATLTSDTSVKCSYEVAKYNKAVHFLKYVNDAPTDIKIGQTFRNPVKQWFECYMNRNIATLDYSGRITSFDGRIVVNVKQGNLLYWWSGGVGPKLSTSLTDTVITGIADEGDSVITLPEKSIMRHPQSSSATLDYGYIVPWCNGSYSIPVETCGIL